MKQKYNRIRIKQENMKTTVVIDGQRIKGIKAMDFFASVDELPTLRLEIFAPDIEIDGYGTVAQGGDEEE